MDIHERLAQKYYDYKPVNSAPVMFTLNGVGFSLYGKRDEDPETGTYVKTHVIVLFFLPLLSLGAYRVAKAENGGWYFLGKQSLSTLAKAWNFILAAVVCLSVLAIRGDQSNTSQHQAKIMMTEAEALLEAGETAAAFLQMEKIFHLDNVGLLNTNVQAAERHIRNYLEQAVASPEMAAAETIFSVYARLCEGERLLGVQPEGIVGLGEKLVTRFEAQDPAQAYKLLKLTLALDPINKTLPPREQGLLESWVKLEPQNSEPAIALALILEHREDYPGILALLQPFETGLGDSEGARMLGQVYLRDDQSERAYPLLEAYVKTRLEKMHAATKAFEAVSEELWSRELKGLQAGTASEDFYARYENADEAAQSQMVQEYIYKRMAASPAYLKALDTYQQSNEVVPVVLDLGIVQLTRAQSLVDPEQRKAEFQRSESTFLAIGNQMGESADYQLFLGQVKYWLGKYDEGEQLINKLLDDNGRSPTLLFTVAKIIRDVGDHDKARALGEEAYEKAKDPEVKSSAAHFCSVLANNPDEELTWLRKANPNDPSIVISLNFSQGDKAFQEGDQQKALTHYREGLKVYKSLPRTAVALNNEALGYLSVYRITNDIADLRKASKLMAEAVVMERGNATLLYNAADLVLKMFIQEQMTALLKKNTLSEVGLSDFKFFWRDETEERAMCNAWKAHPDIKQILNYYEKLLVMAPKSINTYYSALWQKVAFREGMADLCARLKEADLDLGAYEEQYREAILNPSDTGAAFALAEMERYQTLLADKQLTAVERAICFSKYNEQAEGYYAHTGTIDLKGYYAGAKQAYETAPSLGTLMGMTEAECLKLHMALVAAEPAYTAMWAKCRRRLSVTETLMLAYSRGGPLAQAMDRNASTNALRDLVKKVNHLFPTTPTYKYWSLFRHTDPAMAAKMVGDLKVLDFETRLEAYLLIAPYDPSTQVDAYFYYLATGQEEKGLAICRQNMGEGGLFPQVL